MRSIKVIFLDLGGVVLEIDWRRTFASAQVEFRPEVVAELAAHDVFHRFECGQATAEEYFKVLGELMGLANSTRLFDAWNDLIIGELPGIARVFDLYSGQIPICALSNTNLTHVEMRFPHYSILNRFDRLFTSCEMGHRKPDPEIYLKAAQAMGALPSECLFIDDSEANVEGARQVGFHAFQTLNDPARTLSVIQDCIAGRI